MSSSTATAVVTPVVSSSSSATPTATASATAAVAAATAVVSVPPALPTLAGKVAIVTGASRGIGRGIALSLARDGAKVIVNYNTDSKSAEAVVNAIKSVPNGAAAAVQADVSKSSDVDRLFAEAKKLYGGVDIVVANTGVGGGNMIASTSNEEMDRFIDINLKGAFYTLRAAANTVNPFGRIIVIGSSSRDGTWKGFGPYACTKAAVDILATTLAQELGSRFITVNSILPGPTGTDMMLGAPKEYIDKLSKLSPMNRIGTPSDIGDAVALLAHESARWITGQSIFVTGGATGTL